jgi:hypothetical protein
MRRTFIGLIFCFAGGSVFCQGARSTNFRPDESGFHFNNAFTNTFFDQQGIKILVAGCSGGMSYTALDYYYRGVRTPKQSYPPPDQSLLYDYIYNRQMTSLYENSEKWLEEMANPFGWQNNEFFYWGLQGTNGGRLQELKSFIDNGIPVPIGLFGAGDSRSRLYNQVIAIGYDCGRYQGALGDFAEDFKIYCYDPAYPDVVSTLQVNKSMHYYYWKDREQSSEHYSGYFVDTKYSAGTPPPDPSSAGSMNDCKARELVVIFKSGENGLHGMDDNCNAMLQFNDGTVQQFKNLNHRMPWTINSTHSAELWLANPGPLTNFKNIIVYTKPCDGLNNIPCYNWDLNQVIIIAKGGFSNDTILNQIGNPILKKYSGRDYSNTFYYTDLSSCDSGYVKASALEPGTGGAAATQLLINFRTGSGDLSGGNNNLLLTIGFRDGSSQVFPNVNGGINWAVNTSNSVTLNLNNPVIPADIMRINLQTSNCPEGTCDDWYFQGITITARGNHMEKVIYERTGNPIYKFSGTNNVYSLILKKY